MDNFKPPPLPPTPVEIAASRSQVQHAVKESALKARVPEQLPLVITDKTVDELRALVSNPSAPQILEGSIIETEKDQYGDAFEQQKSDLEKLKTRLGVIVTREVEVLEPLRATTQQKLEESQALETQWLEVESKMYRSLQPFSMPALQSRMEQAVAEADDLSEVLKESFLSSKPSSMSNQVNGDLRGQDNGVAVVEEFVQQYRKACKLKHLRSERLDRLKENRVGRVYM